MNSKVFLSGLLAVSLMASGVCQAQSQGLRALQPLPGYSCMSLNITQDQVMDFSAIPPVLAAPRPDAPKIGTTSSVVIVADPVHAENGFVSMLMLDGRPGWVQAVKLRPYRNASHPNVRCVPSMMSNGKPGFAFPQ